MGSQDVYDAGQAASKVIVLKVPGGFQLAQFESAWQPDRSHGGTGPVVLTYQVDDLPPYVSEDTAQKAAARRLKE